MTEREYIDVSDLTCIRTIRYELRELIAESSDGKITEDEYKTVSHILYEWAQRYTAVVKTDGEG